MDLRTAGHRRAWFARAACRRHAVHAGEDSQGVGEGL